MISNAVTGEHFLQGLANSRIDWRANFARANRDEPDLRETLYQGPLASGNAGEPHLPARGRVAKRLSACSTRSTTRRSIRGVNWAVLSNAGGRPTQFKFGVNYVERDRDFQSRRFRYIPVILTKDGPALTELCRPRPRRSTRRTTSAPPSVSTRKRGRPTPTTAIRRRRPDTAWSTSRSRAAQRLIVGSARRELRPGSQDVRSVRSVRPHDQRGKQEHRRLPGHQFRACTGGQLEPAAQLRLDGEPARVPRAGRIRVHRRGRQPRDEGQPRSRPRADSEPRRALGALHRQPGRLAASVFFKYFDKPIERVILAAVQPIATFQNADNAQERRHRARGRTGVSARHFFVNANYTFVDSKITLQPDQLTAQTSQERPLAGQSKNLFNMTFEGTVRGFSARAALQLLRRSHRGRRAPTTAPDVVEQGRGSLDLSVAQRIRGLNIRLTLENLDRQRVPVHPRRSRISARTNSGGPSPFHSATASSTGQS